jgi:hypothetical protein
MMSRFGSNDASRECKGAGRAVSSRRRCRYLIVALGIRTLSLFFGLLKFFFCLREEAQQYCSPIFVGLFRKQLVKVLDVALSNDFIDHRPHSIKAPPRLSLLRT